MKVVLAVVANAKVVRVAQERVRGDAMGVRMLARVARERVQAIVMDAHLALDVREVVQAAKRVEGVLVVVAPVAVDVIPVVQGRVKHLVMYLAVQIVFKVAQAKPQLYIFKFGGEL